MEGARKTASMRVAYRIRRSRGCEVAEPPRRHAVGWNSTISRRTPHAQSIVLLGSLRPRAALLAVAGVLGLCASSANAQVVNEVIRLRAKSVSASDFFGTSVALSDAFAAIGAPRADGAESDTGAVYLFDPTTGTQRSTLFAAGGRSRDEFGTSIAFDGSLVAIGAPFDDEIDQNAGAAYVFDAVTGTQVLKLTAASGQSLHGASMQGEAFAGFGQSVDIEAGRVIVGSPNTFANDNPTGAAYIFDIETASLLLRLEPGDPGALLFGAKVALSGDRAVVTAPFDATPGYGRGAAFVFDTTTGERLFTLLPDAPGGNFGESLSVSGDIAVIGAPAQPIGGEHLYGAAYVFDIRTGERMRMLLPDDADGRGFGRSVSSSEGTVVVGAWDSLDGGVFTAGAAYAFEIPTGVQRAKLLPSDGGPGRGFGFAAALRDGRAVVGSYLGDDPTEFTGAAHLFELPHGGACIGDIDGDGRVDAVDLGLLLDAWGRCTAGCPADLDSDGSVGAGDLARVLDAWGACR